MPERFRIHGDNIVECERIISIIKAKLSPISFRKRLSNPASVLVEMEFVNGGENHSWELELLPGFNKGRRNRWRGNIFASFEAHGSLLGETPDVIVTSVQGNEEVILFAVEFCSALQAGNQAWQRSGRAFSIGRTGCPYLYVVDFVKYELDSRTRERKNLRFPNAAVPYSYINFSRKTGNFVAQIYVQSEEFNSQDEHLSSFDLNDLASDELASYITKKMLGMDTHEEEVAILEKNFNVVKFLSLAADSGESFSVENWQNLHDNEIELIDFSKENELFPFHKNMSSSSGSRKSKLFVRLVEQNSVGLASKNLPFGLIPRDKRRVFSEGLADIFNNTERGLIAAIEDEERDLVVCLLKGFKPGGDDNRPDRGALPLAVMLTNPDVEILTYLYGPLLARNHERLENDRDSLMESNGLWKVLFSLSDYLLLDMQRLPEGNEVEFFLDNSGKKRELLVEAGGEGGLRSPLFSNLPTAYQEDDVDTCIHYMFTESLQNVCFEGLCNPPGGDWSGLSVKVDGGEKRWLSLPRVSDAVGGKRPDHVIEIFNAVEKPLLLIIESKEQARSLEDGVGPKLVEYVSRLMDFVPSAERMEAAASWNIASQRVESNAFKLMSAAAYLESDEDSSAVFERTGCELLLALRPGREGWRVQLYANNPDAVRLKEYIEEILGSPINVK